MPPTDGISAAAPSAPQPDPLQQPQEMFSLRIVFPSRTATPDDHAQGILDALGFTPDDEQAYQERHGVNLRQHYRDHFAAHDQRAAHYRRSDGRLGTNVPLPVAEYRQMRQFIAARRGGSEQPPPLVEHSASSPGERLNDMQTRGRERSAALREQYEAAQQRQARGGGSERSEQATGAPVVAGTTALMPNLMPNVARALSAETRAAVQHGAQRVLPLAGRAAPALAEAAPVVAGIASQVAVGAVIIDRLYEAGTRPPPPPLPPLRMTEEDEPLPQQTAPPAAPTDTAQRPRQPDIRVAPEGGESLARPTASNPTTTAPTSAQPPSPRTSPPQGEPPQLPPVDLDRLIPTALTAASLARLEQQRQTPSVNLSNVPTVDYRGQPYTEAQRQRIAELGDDPGRGFRLEEGEAGLAAEERHGLQLTRYSDRGLEFVDQHGNYWDVVSPMSEYNGRNIFRLDNVINALDRHFLKGNVVLDYGRLNSADAATLQRAVESLTDAERRGRTIIIVRDGG